MIKKTIDFNTIQSRIDAARNLQDADQDDDCKNVLLKLAEDIKENIK